MRTTTITTVTRTFFTNNFQRRLSLSSLSHSRLLCSIATARTTFVQGYDRRKRISNDNIADTESVHSTVSHQYYKCPSSTISFRYFSSSGYNNDNNKNRNSNNKNKNNRFDLKALPFSISPEEALESFRKWAENDQGLRYLMSYNSVRIGAAYVPVWSFDLNIRFKQQEERKQQDFSWKPPIFKVYDRGQKYEQDVIYLSGLAAYSGYSYRRSLINPVHSTTLLFMGEQTQPFGGWMLNDMILKDSGNPINVIPDAWNSTQGRSFSVVKGELQEIVDEAWTDNSVQTPIVQTQVVSARRVFMPTFVIEYNILGLEYKAFVSGCDQSAPIGGVSHRLFESSNISMDGLSPEFHRSSRNLLAQLSGGASQLLRTINLPVLVWLFRPFYTALWFVFIRILSITPIVGVAGGLFTGFRKVLQPWMDNKKASADWERQRQHEAEMAEDENDKNKSYMNDFTDISGKARAHFNKNKDAILRSLSGDAKHEEGDFNWYSDWQAWAQQQWDQQATKQQQQQQQWEQSYHNQQQQEQKKKRHQSQQQRQRSESKKKGNDKYRWPFDINDPYSVLGIDRYATDVELSNAFRKEMLQYHPDTQPNISEAHKKRSVERSKLITNAYRIIKTERKATAKK